MKYMVWHFSNQGNGALLVFVPTGGIQSHLLNAQLMLLQSSSAKGLDARCVSNLVWALVKLEVADHSEGCTEGNKIVEAASPLIVYFLPQSSSQVPRSFFSTDFMHVW